MKSYSRRQAYRRRENVIFPILILMVIIATVVMGTLRTWQTTIRRMEESLQQQVSNQADSFVDKIESEFALLNGIGLAFSVEELANPDGMSAKLAEYADKTDFLSVSFAYRDGLAYCNDGRCVNISERWYFQQCMEGKAAVERLENGKLLDGTCFAIAVPVVFAGQVEGVLVADYSEEKFRSMFQSVCWGISNFSFVCDAEGQVVVSTQDAFELLEKQSASWNGEENIFRLLENAELESGSLAYIEECVGDRRGGEITYAYDKDTRYAMFEPLAMNDWYVVTVLPEVYVHTEAMEVIQITYIMLAFVLVAAMSMIIYLVFRESRRKRIAKEEAEALHYILEHDDLTGVYEEKAFQIKVAERLKEQLPEEYCVVYLDVYKFKLINEMFGYEKGDEFLKVMAQELQKLADFYNGLCGRINGDKFVLFLPHRKEVVDEFYTKKVKNPRILPIEIYLHYGIYVIQNQEISVATMIDCAQLAQRAVKGNYDNCVSYYNDELKQKLLKEQEILNSMTTALDNGEFIIYLQPQYDYRNGCVSGAEVLVRWNSPTRGLIPPGEFIPIFETNGFIIKLDENVWEQSCKLLRKWIDEGRHPFPISVNVSRTDLLRGEVAEKLMSLLDKYQLTPDLLRVEITESAYMDNPQQLIMEISKLREHGFVVEMDDFGSGYSSLNMLKDVPINVLKTDLKFLDNTGIDRRRDQILDHVIHMAHQIGLLVVAEGVETKEQADYLINLNCRIMQGYYFSKPIPVHEFENLVYGKM